MNNSEQALHRFEHHAMATVFEVVVAGEEESYARQAAMECFGEIDRLEGLLSRFNACSEVGQINRLRPGESVRVGLDVFECLQLAQQVFADTGGAFDVTVGPALQCYRSEDGAWQEPAETKLEAARARTGMTRLVLHDSFAVPESDGAAAAREAPRALSVGVQPDAGSDESVVVDLGGIGKGYALDKAAELLTDWGIRSALLHGGTSTALAFGEGGWPLGVGGDLGADAGLERILLSASALSGSGKEVKGEHVIDPRTGRPATGHQSAWVVCSSAAEADALSTAFMVMTQQDAANYCSKHEDICAMVAGMEDLKVFGDWERYAITS